METMELPEAKEQRLLFVFDNGEEVITTLKKTAEEMAAGSYVFSALGAFSRVVLGYFDWQKKEYKVVPMHEQVEVVSLTGNITKKESGLAVHAHVVVCKSDGSAYGGHLLEGFVRPTLEMNVSKFPVMVERTLDAEAKIPLIDVKQTRERLKAA